MKFLKPFCLIAFCTVLTGFVHAQEDARTIQERCGTMQNLQLQLNANPQLKQKFEEEKIRFNNAVRQGIYRLSSIEDQQNANRTALVIPVIFHIVLTNPAAVTDAQIHAQLDTLNRDYSGTNGDSVVVPSYFKPFFGRSAIQFCLAQQTPTGDPTSGIDRVTTTKASFSNTDDGVKHASTGGTDVWDPTSYYNVWITSLSNGILGYATFPGMAATDPTNDGVAIDYRSLPGGSLPQFNGGKTLTHETGHYFNLIHIWGDDNGGCDGSDDVDDTPNQANSSTVCISGIKTDNCTTGGNGIMYQNYMDYTYDNCLVMFTNDQVARMESAVQAYRSSLLTSIACKAPVSYNIDAQLKSVNQPAQRVCTNPFAPVITIRNRGTQTLTTLTINTAIDNVATSSSVWTGSLAQLSTADVTLNPITITAGNHVLKVYVSNPNNSADQNVANDTITLNLVYNDPVTSISESFEGNIFPPPGWDIINPDKGITWQKATGIAKTGNGSVMIDNFDYNASGQQDYLRLPVATIPSTVDSAFFSFQVAAAAYTALNTANNTWDTLEVLISTDCGTTYTSLYKKWGSTLVTHTAALTTAFVPTAAEWRKDSINISNYIGTNKILLAFRNTTNTENNIYIDDVNLRTITINPNLKSQGFLVTPSPTSGLVTVQFYPQPTNIKGIEIFNMGGQKVAEIVANGQSNYYTLDISRYSAGAYMVRVVMGNSVMVKKIIKY